jgi:cytochrome o ubiquinol oxidase operon protein cyoD
MGVHPVFFLHMTSGPDNLNHAMALAFGLLIVFMVVGGSLWIMADLDEGMMPASGTMDMATAHHEAHMQLTDPHRFPE